MKRHLPHNVQRSSARVALVYKNFAANKNISHIGLGVAAMTTQRTLREHGYWADVWPATSAADISAKLSEAQTASMRDRQQPISHVVISAPWIPTPDLQALLMRWPDVEFAVVSHSNLGFLMADPNGIKLLREASHLALGHHNFTIAGNCQRFANAWSTMYGHPVAWLPNLYDLESIKHVGQRHPWHHGSPLRIGVFGATRPLKNMVSAVAACVEISSALRTDVEVWMSTGREEGGGSVKSAVQQLVAGLRHCRIVESGWQSWPGFRQVVSRMNLLFSPSYTESFNMVTADGIAEGVASVVSDAIDWVPTDWVANADDVGAITRVARRLLGDAHAVNEGQTALRHYVERGLPAWRAYLD